MNPKRSDEKSRRKKMLKLLAWRSQ